MGPLTAQLYCEQGDDFKAKGDFRAALKMAKRALTSDRQSVRASLLQADIEKIEFSFDPEFEELEEISVKPKSTDITLEVFGLAWVPYRKNAAGQLGPDWS